jgi:phosphatidylglycerophosphate synthase
MEGAAAPETFRSAFPLPMPDAAVPPPAARRPLSSRDTRWARAVARGLARAGVNPNLISFASIVFAAVGAWALARLASATGDARITLALVAAAGIQLRLAANLFDGLVAVEHGRKQATGDLWNEVPDRFADVALLLGAGYGLAGEATVAGQPVGPLLGWSAALLAVATAYVRQLGGALGLPQDFRGPLAKQQRMFVLTLGVLATLWVAPGGDPAGGGGTAAAAATASEVAGPSGGVAAGGVAAGAGGAAEGLLAGGPVAVALVVIVLGAMVTFARRLHGIAAALRARAAASAAAGGGQGQG